MVPGLLRCPWQPCARYNPPAGLDARSLDLAEDVQTHLGAQYTSVVMWVVPSFSSGTSVEAAAPKYVG